MFSCILRALFLNSNVQYFVLDLFASFGCDLIGQTHRWRADRILGFKIATTFRRP